MTQAVHIPSRQQPGCALLQEAIAACRAARAPDRTLDTRIALAVFPGLEALRPVEIGIWAQEDGSRVRALRYSASTAVAATLVPAGHWVEDDPRGVRVCGARGHWIGFHKNGAIALCIAALEARMAEAADEPERCGAPDYDAQPLRFPNSYLSQGAPL